MSSSVNTVRVNAVSTVYETDCLLALNIKLQPPVYIRMAVSAYCCYQFEYKMSNVGSFSRLDCTALCTTPEAISSLGYNRTEFCPFLKKYHESKVRVTKLLCPSTYLSNVCLFINCMRIGLDRYWLTAVI